MGIGLRIVNGAMSTSWGISAWFGYKNRQSRIEFNNLSQELREEQIRYNGMVEIYNSWAESLGEEKREPVEVIDANEMSTFWPTLGMIIASYGAIEFGCQAIFKKSPTMTLARKIGDWYFKRKIRSLEESGELKDTIKQICEPESNLEKSLVKAD